MKTIASLLFFAFLGGSCSNTKVEQFDKAASKLCKCMEEKMLEKSKDTLGMDIDLTEINYKKCIKRIAKKTDPFDPQLTISLQNNCPNLLPVHQIYTRKTH